MQVTATLINNLHGHTDEVGRLLLSPDGKTLAASDDIVITLWDVETGALRSTSEETDDRYFGIAFSPDSKWLAAASDEGNGLIWNAETGRLEHVLNVEDERMLSLVFSADSKLIVTGSENLRVWDVATGELQRILSVPDDRPLSFTAVHERNEFPYPPEIFQVAFSPDGKLLASACPNTSTVSLWNTESWKLDHTIQGCALDFSPDGKCLAVWAIDHQSIQIYDTHIWQLESTIQKKEDGSSSGVFSPDSKSFVTKPGRQAKLWSIKSGEVIKTFTDLNPTASEKRRKECCTIFDLAQEDVCKLAFSPDGKILMTGAGMCGLRFWDVVNEELLLELKHEDGARDPWNPQGVRGDPPAVEVLFGDDGGKVAIAFPDGSVRIWDVRWEVEST